MDETEKTAAAQKLREDLRNVRRGQSGTSEASGSSVQDSGSTGQSSRPVGRPPGGNTGKASGNTTGAGNNNRSSQVSIERSGQDYGRSLDDGGSNSIGGYQASSSSRLERIDTVPERPEPTKRPVGRPRKEQVVDAAANIKKALFKKAAVLTEKEATEYKEPLISAIQSYGEYGDRYIKWRTQEIDMPDIWGNLTDVEAGALANIMIRRGMKNAHAAEVVRNMINGEDYVSVGVMLVPRVIATTEQMKKAPPKVRKRRGNRENIN